MKQAADLCDSLRPVFEYEIGRGNCVERVDRPAGTKCPLAVVFAMPLDIDGFMRTHELPHGVRTWANRDQHYPLEDGYTCEKTNHAIAGPAAVKSNGPGSEVSPRIEQ